MKITKQFKQEQNLNVLLHYSRNYGRTFKGYQKLSALIDEGKDRRLEYLLRNHLDKPIVKQAEVNFRDEVDFLITFYCLLEIAILADFIPAKLSPALRNEIRKILGNTWVRKYYEDYYPIFLAKLIYEVAENDIRQQPVGIPSMFNEFLLLNKTIDIDVEHFLWLLDDGLYDKFDIYALQAMLKNRSAISRLLEKPRREEDVVDSAFWGFIKFTEYMNRFAGLLQRCDDKLMRSAFWYYRAYWFERMKRLMRDVYLPSVRSIKTLTNAETFDEYAIEAETISTQKLNATERRDAKRYFKRSQTETTAEIRDTLLNIEYNLSPAHGDALKKYYLRLKSLSRTRIPQKLKKRKRAKVLHSRKSRR